MQLFHFIVSGVVLVSLGLLQYFLAKRYSRWLTYLLPTLTALISFVLIFSYFTGPDGIEFNWTVSSVLGMIVSFLLMNIPTGFFFVLSIIGRNKSRSYSRNRISFR